MRASPTAKDLHVRRVPLRTRSGRAARGVLVPVAAVRIAVALVLYFSAPLPIMLRAASHPAVFPPWWIYAALSSTFMALGLGLAVANRRDARAAWLGGVLTLAGVPFVTPLLHASSPTTWLINVRPEAFTAALLWCFLARFPTNIESLFPVWNDVSTWNLAALSPIRFTSVG